METRTPRQPVPAKPHSTTHGLDLRTVDVETGVAYLMEQYDLDREAALEKMYVAQGRTDKYEHAIPD